MTDTDRRAGTARLAIGLSRAGCEVFAVSTPRHPLLKTRAVRRAFPYSGLRPLNSLIRAIEATEPQILIPCDDRAVEHLHELYAHARAQHNSGRKLAALIERSLGDPKSYPLVCSRQDLLRIAQEEGLRVPATRLVRTRDDLDSWQAEQPLPWVLKADGSWGGRGVRIAHTHQLAKEFFREISRPFRAARAIKRWCVNRDPFWVQPWLERVQPAVVAQSYVRGIPANCAVVCWEGEVLAGIAAEVVNSEGETGPANVVRVVDNPEMMRCAERIASRLGLSGFFGLDFMIESGTGASWLIEMNPRCTPLCHLQLGKGRDMVGMLSAQLTGRPYRETPPVTDRDMIAYFPQAGGSGSKFHHSTYEDVPEGEPELVRELLRPWPERTFLFRINNQLHHLMTSATVRPVSGG